MLRVWDTWFILISTAVFLVGALPDKPYLLYSNTTSIGSIGLTSDSRDVLISELNDVMALGVDMVDRKIYLGERGLREIYRSDMNGSNLELLMTDVGKVEGIAVDWVARNLYWTTYTSAKVQVAQLDGNYRKILINTGLEYPRGIALDPEKGFLFFSDWGFRPMIARSTLAGTNIKQLVIDQVTYPNGLTIDYVNRRLYWIDAYHDTINSINYDGGQRTKIFEDTSIDATPYHGFDLDYINGDIYWSDWRWNAIFGLNQTGSVATIFKKFSIPSTRTLQGVMGVVVVDDSRQPQVTNRCGSNNGSCEQLCLLKPNGFQCACKLGFVLLDDGKKCEDAFKDEFIMFADADAAAMYQIQTDSIDVEPIPIKFGPEINTTRPVALGYDPVEDRLYWTDVTQHKIFKAFRNGSSGEILFGERIGVADGLTIDLAGRILYWTSTTYDVIEIADLDGSQRRVIIDSDLDEPRDIIVDPIGGYMYWADWGNQPKIECAFMNGSQRKTLVNESIVWPNGLTLDHIYNTLYWADAWEDTIEMYDFESGKRQVVLNERVYSRFWGFVTISEEIKHPYGLALLHEHIYWTDWHTKAVYRASINSGANVTMLSSGLGRPMDIHAYSVIPKQEQRKIYTFIFPPVNGEQRGDEFTCYRETSCPTFGDPPACPTGYTSVRVGQKCGLYCRNIQGNTYRCPCGDWVECAVRQTYLFGCTLGYYATFKVRECVQAVRPSRCPYETTMGSLNACTKDESCPGTEKCCKGKCSTVQTLASHPCQTNNGGCDTLCLSIPGGYRCDCKPGYTYSTTTKTCVKDTTPPTSSTSSTPSTSSTSSGGCDPIPSPSNGESSCRSAVVPLSSQCTFQCNKGFALKGYSPLKCFSSGWSSSAPTCVERGDPQFSSCPSDISVSTDPGLPTKSVNWVVPTATDHEGDSATVTVQPNVTPPVKLRIGITKTVYTATDDEGLLSTCQFSIEVKDEEPPSFGNTCPDNIKKYIDNQDGLTVSWVEPKATDNSQVPPSITKPGINPGSKFSVGITTLTYKATDGAGLPATCSFQVQIINVCSSARCGFGSTCQLKGASNYQCVCDIICTANDNPVCGSDGITYSNECRLRATQCLEKRSISVAKTGACDVERKVPRFSNCSADISASTDPDLPTKSVYWTVPTATDHEGDSVPVTVQPNVTPPVKLRIGTTTITYTATDDQGLRATCQFNVEVKDEEPPSFGNTCPNNIIKYVDNHGVLAVSWGDPKATDNSGVPPTITKPGINPGSNFSVGITTLTYKATDGAGLSATCSFQVQIINVCSSVKCGFGATCQLKDVRSSQCVCNIDCLQFSKVSVCGSDGLTYQNECILRQKSCKEQKNIIVIKTGACDCDFNSNEDFKTSSTASCSLNSNSMECDVTCRDGYQTAIDAFLKIRCSNKRWVRANIEGKYVPMGNMAPSCQKTKTKSLNTASCPSQYQEKFFNHADVCVPCSPGSHYDRTSEKCKECDVTMYQDLALQDNCKPCDYQRTGKTTTTKGAESCFLNVGKSYTTMVIDSSLIDKEELQEDISEALTNYCQQKKCSFNGNGQRRKKRASDKIVFKKEDIIILSMETTKTQTTVDLLILNPASNGVVPDTTLSPTELKNVLANAAPKLPFPVKTIKNPSSNTSPNEGGKNEGKSKTPMIAGIAIVGLVLVVGLIIGVVMYRRKRTSPPTQTPSTDHFSHVNRGVSSCSMNSDIYEDPDAGYPYYDQINSPPPSYRETPGPGSIYVCDSVDQANAGKDPPPYDGLVTLPPTYSKDKPIVFSKRRLVNNNYGDAPRARASGQYEVPLATVPPPVYQHPRPSRSMQSGSQSGHYQTPGVTLPSDSSGVLLQVSTTNYAVSNEVNVNNEEQMDTQVRAVVDNIDDSTKEQK